jgi:hypothetical protein
VFHDRADRHESIIGSLARVLCTVVGAERFRRRCRRLPSRWGDVDGHEDSPSPTAAGLVAMIAILAAGPWRAATPSVRTRSK